MKTNVNEFYPSDNSDFSNFSIEKKSGTFSHSSLTDFVKHISDLRVSVSSPSNDNRFSFLNFSRKKVEDKISHAPNKKMSNFMSEAVKKTEAAAHRSKLINEEKEEQHLEQNKKLSAIQDNWKKM